LTGGAGDERFVFMVDGFSLAGSGIDTITDFTAGAASADKIELIGNEIVDFATLLGQISDDGTDTTIALGGGNDITLLGVLASELHADDFLLRVVATGSVDLDASNDLFVGDDNVTTGTLDISQGAVLEVIELTISGTAGSAASVTVVGAGTTLTVGTADAVDNDLIVGGFAGGTGTLTVSGGATLNAFFVQIGRGGVGSLTSTMTITGLGTTVNVSNDFGHFGEPFLLEGGFLRVARNDGDRGELFILDQAVVNITANDSGSGPGFQIAREAGSVGTVTVNNATVNISQTGPATTLEGGPFLQVGRSGDGTLTIENGGVVSLSGDGAFVQVSRGDGTVTVLAQSTLEILTGGQLLVDGAGKFAGMNIGQEVNGDGSVLVRGSGSLLSLTGLGANVHVGRDGTGSLTVDQEGQLQSTFINVGRNAGST
jgi:T5SS/PEP-CTERM-associated repeat protein